MSNKNMASIGLRIAKLREERGLSQKQLADELEKMGLKVRRETVTQWENGSRDLKTEYTVKLADFFDVSADWILGRSDLKTTDEDTRKIHDLLPLSEKAIQVLFQMAAPDNLGGDPDILYALNAMLEGLSQGYDDNGWWNTDGYVLVDISEYLRFRPLEDSDIPKHLLNRIGLSEHDLLENLNKALETALLQDISNSLKYLRKRYYKE